MYQGISKLIFNSLRCTKSLIIISINRDCHQKWVWCSFRKWDLKPDAPSSSLYHKQINPEYKILITDYSEMQNNKCKVLNHLRDCCHKWVTAFENSLT